MPLAEVALIVMLLRSDDSVSRLPVRFHASRLVSSSEREHEYSRCTGARYVRNPTQRGNKVARLYAIFGAAPPQYRARSYRPGERITQHSLVRNKKSDTNYLEPPCKPLSSLQ